ncbi:HlyD family secretion protein [Dickeya solani]|uniref:Transporter, membrane fusion protein (MFP) family n=1 Tax=Dickeya solani D s0432-1 TaxID=1231725 RepID=A0AAV3KHB0_9GAMM|nr:HlyD family secretion protein [Dickeya solani]ANE76122.1 secretion protein HlyD [Dickeya solani IPO 2222]AUC43680.1 Multidrug resistance protein [Dickeya solani RNS 08.23.3.1.A]AUH08469.1 secretion protein HlyD [Dickeya solani D s0432-1]AUH12467.1 secretion protein HlyD [Dickeya solani]AYQ46578.1 putative multidrug resistance protein EmrK [Dickeya solani]
MNTHASKLAGFRRMSQRQRTFLLAGAALLLLAVMVLAYWFHQRFTHIGETDARVMGEVISLASRESGWVTARPVIDGDAIHKDQLLAQIDDRDARLRLAEQEGNLAAADAQISYSQTQRQVTDLTTQASLDEAQAKLASSESAVNNAGYQLSLAQNNFQRDDQLLKSNLTARKTWDESHTTLLQRQSELREAEAQRHAQQAALNNAVAQRNTLQVLDRQIEMQRQQRIALQAQVDQLKQEIADRALRSPVDGVVDRTIVNVGSYVQAGQWIMLVHDPRNLWVEANIKETAIGRVRIGQKVDIQVDAYPDKHFNGHVIRVGNAATNQFALLPSPNPSGNFTKITQRVPVRIALDNPENDSPDNGLKPGLMAEVSINVAD